MRNQTAKAPSIGPDSFAQMFDEMEWTSWPSYAMPTQVATMPPRVELTERADEIEINLRVPDGVELDSFATECHDGVFTVTFHRTEHG